MNMKRWHRCERGSALLFAMVTLLVLSALSVAWLGAASARVHVADQGIQDIKGLLLADAAFAEARVSLDAAGDGNIGTAEWSDTNNNGVPEWDELSDPPAFGDGNYWTRVTVLDANRKRITAYGRPGTGPANGAVFVAEMIVQGTNSVVHPAFTGEYSIYVGDGDLTLEGSDRASGYYCTGCSYFNTSWWSAAQHGQRRGHSDYQGGGNNGDVVSGNIYVNGDLNVNGGATVQGDVKVTGDTNTASSDSIDGETTKVEEENEIPPPSFMDMDYKNIPNIINVADQFEREDQILQVSKRRISGAETENIVSSGVTTLDPDNPSHIFAKESFTEDAYGTEETDATNYQFGDWATHNGGDGEDMIIKENGNGKTYYIEGNLWIDPLWYGPTLSRDSSEASAGDGVQITVVVVGNIYIGDEILLDNMAKSGIAFIAITKRDENGVDVNENDDSSDDLVENSGNIMFGDLNKQARAPTINAMLFAEKNFEDRQSKDGNPIEFTVSGLMAAGGSVVLDRGEGDDHVKMSVSHDQRILDGNLTLPNLPQGGAGEESIPIGPWVPVVRWNVR